MGEARMKKRRPKPRQHSMRGNLQTDGRQFGPICLDQGMVCAGWVVYIWVQGGGRWREGVISLDIRQVEVLAQLQCPELL